MGIYSRCGGNTATLAAESLQILANDVADPGSMSISGLASKEYLFVRAIASESETTIIVQTLTYTPITSVVSTTSGLTTANIVVAGGEFEIFTGTGSTSDPTLVAADIASIFLTLEETPIPSNPTKPFSLLGVG